MKKVLLLVLLFCFYIASPMKAAAIYLDDGTSKSNERETKERETSILVAPDDNVSSNEAPDSIPDSYIREVEPSVSAPYVGYDLDQVIYEKEGTYEIETVLTSEKGEEVYRTTSIEEDTIENDSLDTKNNNLIGILLLGGIGSLGGLTASYFIFLKRK